MEYNFNEYRNIVTTQKISETMYTTTAVTEQARSVDGVEWERKSIKSSATSDVLSKSIQDALFTITVYLDSIQGDLFGVELEIVDDERLN